MNQGNDGALRLQVRLARSGLASRRKCEEYIASGRVSVNGRTVIEPGSKVNANDAVYVDGRPIGMVKRKLYAALHKPVGFLCSNSDPQGRPLAKSLLEANINERIFHVGRLDCMSSGLILYTNDGAFAQMLTHPSSAVEKEYIITTKTEIPTKLLERFERGIQIENIRYRALRTKILGPRKVNIVLVEGKNRELREVFRSAGIGIKKVHRVRIGSVTLEGLPPGRYRLLSAREVKAIKGKTNGNGH